MALKRKFITGVEGMTSISDSEFFGSAIYGLFREGKPLFETNGTPTGKQFRLIGTVIDFDVNIPIIKSPKNVGSAELLLPEQFLVIYRN